jgi:mono/diheme cytochrome c family protein
VRPLLTTLLAAVAMLAFSACGFGSSEIDVASNSPEHDGAVLFATRCSGCHSLDAAGTQGTGNRGVRTQGPDLNQRKVNAQDTLYAIQNGGFSGAIMPQNILVGDEAEAVARFVSKYSGQDAVTSVRPGEQSSGP